MKETIAIQFCKQNNKVPAKSLRTHCVSVRFNQDELKLLNKNVVVKARRVASLSFLDKLPLSVPAINIQAGNH